MKLQEYLSFILPFLAVIAGIYSLRFLTKETRFIFFFVCFGLLTELLLLVASELGVKDNRPALHFYVMIEFLLIGLFYAFRFRDFLIKNTVRAVIIGFESYAFINILFIQGLHVYPVTRSVEGLLMVLFSLFLFYKIMTEVKIRHLFKAPEIWINSAVLFYFAGNFFFNILYSIMLENSVQFLKLVIAWFYTGLNTVFYLMIAIGFFRARLNKRNAKL